MKRNSKPRTTSAEIRLLPAVIGIGAILFVLKAGGLAFSAQAASPAPAPQAAAPNATATAAKPAGAQKTADPTAAIGAALPMPPGKSLAAAANPPAPADNLSPELEGAGVSSAEMDVLTSLSDRRDALEQRQRELDLRANTITATEKRVDDKIAQLKALQAKIEGLLGERDQKEAAQLDALVKVYTAMKPKDAARVFATLDDDVRLGVAGRMKAETMAGILSSLPPEVAQKLTLQLAGRYKMNPETTAAAAATQPATPVAAAPAAAGAPAPAGAAPKPAASGG